MTLVWQDEFSVGIKEIDLQHREMINMINDLNEALEKSDHLDEEVSEILNRLAEYAMIHFATEEKYFELFKYPLAASHRLEHESFKRQIEDFMSMESEMQTAHLAILLGTFLEEWLIEHIVSSDGKYAECFKENGLK